MEEFSASSLQGFTDLQSAQLLDFSSTTSFQPSFIRKFKLQKEKVDPVDGLEAEEAVVEDSEALAVAVLAAAEQVEVGKFERINKRAAMRPLF